MGLDPRYIIASDLQSYFVDKDTGLPLSGGTISFFSDVNRTTPKNVYIITGTPPNYSYISIGSTVTLSAVGTVQYAGSDVILYYFPYDANGNIELYYVTVVSSGSVSQFTREGWPNLTAPDSNPESIFNYVPNGQFLTHNNIPATDTTSSGQITQAVTQVASGGWSFERPIGTISIDFVTFTRLGTISDIPTANPRYEIRLQCTSPHSGDTFKGLRLKFRDVNKFASDSQEYTLYFEAHTNTGSTQAININVIKNFGSGGSSTTTTNIEEVTIPVTSGAINVPILFGTNDSQTLGPNDDDYVQVEFAVPPTSNYDLSITDVVLTVGNVVLTMYPQTTDARCLSDSVAGWMDIPNYNGMDYYLPTVRTPYGLTYDTSTIGFIFQSSSSIVPVSYILPDGSTYEVSAYSNDLIPYQRLANAYWINSLNIYRYGSGYSFLNAYSTNFNGEFRLTTNVAGSTTSVSDGTLPTGFTFTTVSTGNNTYNLQGKFTTENSSKTFYQFVNGGSQTTAATIGTTSFTVNIYRDTILTTAPEIIQWITTAVTGLASKYILLSSNTTSYYIWFTVDGIGTDPAIGGRTGIQINLFSHYSATDLARICAETLNGFQISNIQTVTASSIPAGAYFNFYTSAPQHYVVYYIKDGVGNNPNVPNTIAIPVSIAGTDNAATVATKTLIDINQKYVGVPDLRGLFLRGWDNGSGIDPDGAQRFSNNTALAGDLLGTFQFDQIYSHFHFITGNPQNVYGSGSGQTSYQTDANQTATTSTGGFESRPSNVAVNYLIKY